MKCPKYIQHALEMRAKYAIKLMDVCCTVDKFLDEHNIEVDEFDTHTGVEIYINPYSSAKRVLEAICNHEVNK